MPQGSDEIVVKGKRLRGAIDVDTPPLRILDPAALRLLGIVSPEVLLRRLAAQVTAADGSPPLFVINGRAPITEQELFTLPMEAFERVEVMPESVAIRFGYPPTRQVMNFVTKEHFSAVEVTAGFVAPTAGGAASSQMEVQRTAISGDRRSGTGVTWSRRGELRRWQRAIDHANPDEAAQRGVRTLLPGEEKWSANLSHARPLGERATASGIVSIERTRGWSLLGRAVRRSDGRAAIIRQFDDSVKLEAQGTAVAHFAGWRWNAELNGSIQQLDGVVPVIDGVAAQEAGLGRSRSTLTTTDGRVSGIGTVTQLPAGSVTLTTTANVSRNTATRSSDLSGSGIAMELGIARGSRGITRWEAGMEGTLHVPVASRSMGVLTALGDLAFDARAGLSRIANSGGSTLGSLSLNWSPVERVQVNGTLARTRTPPGLGLLGNPLVAQPNTPFFDFTTGRDASITLVTGGQLRLTATTRTDSNASIDYAFGPQRAYQLSLRYTAIHEDRPVGTISAATREVQDAFPELFVRDPAGRLTIVRSQPVNFLDSDTKKISLAFTANGTIGGKDDTAAYNASDGTEASGQVKSYFVSINPTFQLTDRLRLRQGLPMIDRLRGDTTDGTIDLARARVSAFGGLGYRGIATNVAVDWQGATRLRGGDSGSDLRAASLTKVNLAIDASVDQIWPQAPWTRQATVSLSVENLFNARPRVSNRDGVTPLRFQPSLLDPLGRTISLRLRKLF